METITFNLGRLKKIKYQTTLTEGQILVAYLAAIKEKQLPDLITQIENLHSSIDIPNYVIGPYKARGYKVEEYSKGDGTYRAEVIPELILQLARENSELFWERIE